MVGSYPYTDLIKMDAQEAWEATMLKRAEAVENCLNDAYKTIEYEKNRNNMQCKVFFYIDYAYQYGTFNQEMIHKVIRVLENLGYTVKYVHKQMRFTGDIKYFKISWREPYSGVI